jgi:hypothetical protein
MNWTIKPVFNTYEENIMTKKFIVLAFGLLFSAAAGAQEFGVTLGVHQTTAGTDVSGASVDGQFNWKGGLAADFELAPMMHFRTGLIYDQRHVDVKIGANKTGMDFSYLDVPANFQYNLNEMVGLFGGLVVGINVDDKVDPPAGTTAADPGAKGLIPLVDVGVNFLFDDLVGFDVYYERGLGSYADHMKDFSTFGANAIYWF